MSVDTTTGTHFPKNPAKFEFDDEVLRVFDNMAYRSILGYGEAHRYMEYFASNFDFPDYCSVWDFGTTTGHGLRSIRKGAGLHPGIVYRGLDCSAHAVEHTANTNKWAEVYQHDLTESLLPAPCQADRFPMAIGVFAYTLQFIEDQEARDRIIQEAYDALIPGGALFVMEKYTLSDPVLNNLAQGAYLEIRKKNGYTLEEIARKTEALRGAMWTQTPEYMEAQLRKVGFNQLHVMYRHWNFGGFLAIKDK